MLNALLGSLSGVAAAWTPASMTNLKVWWDAADTSTISVSGSAVTQWNDKSSSGLNLTQSTSSLRPSSGTTTLNSKNVIAFDGGDTLINTNRAGFKFLHDGTKCVIGYVIKWSNTSTPNSLLVLWQNNGTGDPGQVGSMVLLNDGQFGGAAGSIVARVCNGSGDFGTIPMDNTNGNVITSPNSANLFTHLQDITNGTAANRESTFKNTGSALKSNIKTGTASSSNAGFDFSLGSSDGTSWFINGYIAEFVVATGSDATEDNRVKLRDYLKDKWAL